MVANDLIAIVDTRDYGIIRAPRVLAGENELRLPADIVIDLKKSSPAGALQPYDIMFAPSGTVVGPAGKAGKIVLWVRDASQDLDKPGEQALIVVYTRTGFIALHPVDPQDSNNDGVADDPYSFTRDGRSSGM